MVNLYLEEITISGFSINSNRFEKINSTIHSSKHKIYKWNTFWRTLFKQISPKALKRCVM